ncbi:MAG: ACP S-malonyltransferase [Candidatus Omnitrophota bacterium]|nr:MAG: ACP S-malonyltransferase [Candidatus Omnitrophota bacterium]
MKAVIFPGQGAQYVGMGASFYDNFDEAKEIFSEIDRVVGFKLSEKCFRGPAQDLKDTGVQQLAILAVSIVAYRIFKDSVGDADIGYVCGLSLGEYSCLYAADVLSLEDLVVLVRRRAAAMQKAAAVNPSTMFAVIGLDRGTLSKEEKGGLFFIANINSPSQIAISLRKQDKDKVRDLLTEAGAKRVIELEVSGGFHSPFMEPALKDLKKVIDNLEFRQAKIPIVSNLKAKGSKDVTEIKENLLQQLVSTVLWKDCVEFMVNNGARTFYEVGPSRVLRGLLRKINSAVEVVNIENKQDLETLISA